MLKTYIRLAFRSLLKNKVFSFINVFGLAAGFTCCLLISMYIYHELNYDAYQQYANRLYQIGTRNLMNGKESRAGSCPATMAPLMQHDFPDIESTTRFTSLFEDDKTLLQYRNDKQVNSFYETKGYVADSSFFRLFTYNFKEGNPATALNEPNTVVLSDEIAKKIFGNQPALNKVIHINSNTNGEYDFRVTGVFIPYKTPSHIDARFILSMKGGSVGDWVSGMTDIVNNNMFFSYLLLKPGTDPKKLEAKFDDFIKRHAGEELKASGRYRWQYLTPVKDIHLYANDEHNVTPGGSITYLYILMSIAIITLIIACVNFMNLSTARSAKRATEIGVRKVLGAEKNSLVTQFLWESILLALISFFISLGFTALLLPVFQDISGKEFSFSMQQYGGLFIGFLFIALLAERLLSTPKHYAYLKISEGCNRTCAFCAIPLMRGKHVSKTIEQIIAEAEGLVRRGVKEIMLIAQELTYYGLDIYKKRMLADLLKRLSDVEGLQWIRLHYAYPNKFPFEVLDVMRERENICNYLDMPLQHASDRMLQLMKRQSTKAEIVETLNIIRDKVPGICLRTTLIAGFPGETKDDVEELKSFLQEQRFDRVGVFTYSHEEGTSGYNLTDDVPAAEKQKRAEEIMEVQQEISYKKNAEKVGKTFKVIIDKKEAGRYLGRTEFDSVEVDNEVIIHSEKKLPVGEFVNVKITNAFDYDLQGEVLQR